MGVSDSIDRDGVRIAFDVTGQGPTIVLGHSFLCDRDMWRHQVPALAERYRVVNIDTRGHGRSSRLTGPCTLDDLVADVFAVLDHLGIDRAIWAGLSLGGMVALRAVLAAPDRVTALLLLDTDGEAETTWRKLKYTALAYLVRGLGMKPVIGQVDRQMFGPTTRRHRREVVAEWNPRFLRVNVPSVVWINDAVKSRASLLPHLGEVDVPSLVLVGDEDVATPPARARRLADALPQAQLIEVPGAGHLSTLEQPERVTAAMLDFLNATTGAVP